MKSPHRVSRSGFPARLFIRLLLPVALLTGCTTLTPKPDSIPWHDCYEPITSPEAERFLQQGIALLTEKYGAPEVPVRQVLLRCSVKTEAASGYAIREQFSLTETIDPEQGIFCIYISVPPEHPRFYYLLGHEIGHLLKPSVIGNPKEEQLCNSFSQQLCEQEGKPWDPAWETRKWVKDPNKHPPDL